MTLHPAHQRNRQRLASAIATHLFDVILEDADRSGDPECLLALRKWDQRSRRSTAYKACGRSPDKNVSDETWDAALRIIQNRMSARLRVEILLHTEDCARCCGTGEVLETDRTPIHDPTAWETRSIPCPEPMCIEGKVACGICGELPAEFLFEKDGRSQDSCVSCRMEAITDVGGRSIARPHSVAFA